MASVNKVILIGHLARDPESKTFQDGGAITNFTVATSESWKDKNTGDRKELTEWNRVTAHGKLAEICNQYLRKGAMVYIEGSLRTRKYQKDGADHYATEIRADQMKMLDKRQDGQQAGAAPAQQQRPAPRPAPAPSAGSGMDDGSDIPFRDPMSYRGVHLVM